MSEWKMCHKGPRHLTCMCPPCAPLGTTHRSANREVPLEGMIACGRGMKATSPNLYGFTNHDRPAPRTKLHAIRWSMLTKLPALP